MHFTFAVVGLLASSAIVAARPGGDWGGNQWGGNGWQWAEGANCWTSATCSAAYSTYPATYSTPVYATVTTTVYKPETYTSVVPSTYYSTETCMSDLILKSEHG